MIPLNAMESSDAQSQQTMQWPNDRDERYQIIKKLILEKKIKSKELANHILNKTEQFNKRLVRLGTMPLELAHELNKARIQEFESIVKDMNKDRFFIDTIFFGMETTIIGNNETLECGMGERVRTVIDILQKEDVITHDQQDSR